MVAGAGQFFNHDFEHRSNMFTFVQCQNVTVTDLTVRNSSAWTLVPIFFQMMTAVTVLGSVQNVGQGD